MRVRAWAALATGVATVAALAVALPAAADTSMSFGPHGGHGAKKDDPSPRALKLGREALRANDGWGAAGDGTSGGSAATDANVHVVTTRAELVAALGGDNATNGSNATAKIIFVKGKIKANVDDANRPLTCADYEDPEYSLDAFLTAYDPATWGTEDPSGPLEDARFRSTRNQRERVFINVGSNTTIVGLKGATLDGFNLNLQNVSNVILRNVNFQDAADCFPEWSPGDGSAGNWNSLYDTVTLSNATNVWVDHNTFSDGTNLDSTQPVYLGRPYQVHDGSLDIIRGSNYVTVSYNYFHDHDKTMLIGSTNTAGVDVDKLKVTIHHNRFVNNGQRLPRVRFGQVDVYNNSYTFTDGDAFQYAWGVGVDSAIYAENNFVQLSDDVPVTDVVYDWRGTRYAAMTELGSVVKVGRSRPAPINFLDEYNAANELDIPTDAGWTPQYRLGPVLPAIVVPLLVRSAGSGKLPI